MLLFRNFDTVVSYTTRPMRDGETDGKEHYFIDKDTSKKIISNETICAITIIGEYTYFVTKDEITNRKKNLYVIDPQGLYFLLENYGNLRNYVVIYVKSLDSTREERAKQRAGYNERVYKDRVNAEKYQFDRFEVKINNAYYTAKTKTPMHTVYNNGNDLKPVMKDVENIISQYPNNTMFLIVGRSCSGKDTICRELVNKNERFKKCLNSVLSFLHIMPKTE